MPIQRNPSPIRANPVPISRQSMTSLKLCTGPIHCQFDANQLPISCQSMSMLDRNVKISFANPSPIQKADYIRVKYCTFSAGDPPIQCQSDEFSMVEGSMDLWRIGRLTEIGVDWLWFPRPFRAANAVPIRQSRANPMPIETPFWIGDFSSIRENRGQSCAMQTPIRCQSGLRPTARLLPIQCQSVPIHCQSIVNPVPIHCQSVANPMSAN